MAAFGLLGVREAKRATDSSKASRLPTHPASLRQKRKVLPDGVPESLEVDVGRYRPSSNWASTLPSLMARISAEWSFSFWSA